MNCSTNPPKCDKCGSHKNVLSILDIDYDTHHFLCKDCYIKKFGV